MHYRIIKSATIFTLVLSQTILLAQNDVLHQAQEMLDNKKHDQVIELLLSKEENFAASAQYFYIMGSAYINKLNATDNYFKKGTIASKAKSALLKAIELKPSHTDARVMLSNYYLNAPVIAGGSNTKAKQQADEVMKYDSKRGHMLMASIFSNKKEYKSAEQEYLKVLELDPDDEKIRYWLSNVNLEMKQYDKAMEYANQSREKFPTYLFGHYQYGRIASISKKNIDKGISSIEYFLNKASNDSQPKKHWAYYRLGLLKNEQGKLGEAQEAFKKALELKPDFDQAKKMIN